MDLRLGQRAEGKSSGGRVRNRGQNVRIGVAKNKRPEGENKIDVLPAVDIGDIGALALADDDGVAAHSLVGPDRTAHSAGKKSARLFVAFFRVQMTLLSCWDGLPMEEEGKFSQYKRISYCNRF
jgi:hypothetical protein